VRTGVGRVTQVGEERVTAAWLGLRGPADAAARSVELAGIVRDRLAGTAHPVIHDLGSGTGSMARWLAPRLPGPQHWIMYDRDVELLEHALTEPVGPAVTVETRCRDITRLAPADLRDASLITTSALLDMLTAEEVDRVVDACAAVGCPVLFTLSVVGRVELTPADPLDEAVNAAFNAHQRRTTGGRGLLGPDAVGATLAAFGRHGFDVVVRPSPWRLGAGDEDLTAEWFQGWVGAAREQDPALAAGYAARPLTAAVVHHVDLLAGPELNL